MHNKRCKFRRSERRPYYDGLLVKEGRRVYCLHNDIYNRGDQPLTMNPKFKYSWYLGDEETVKHHWIPTKQIVLKIKVTYELE